MSTPHPQGWLIPAKLITKIEKEIRQRMDFFNHYPTSSAFHPSPFNLHPSFFNLHPLPFILHPSPFSFIEEVRV
jgi:hypothetical protein